MQTRSPVWWWFVANFAFGTASLVTAQVDWRNTPPSLGRFVAPAAFDALRDRLVVLAPTNPAATWLFDGVDWQRALVPQPAPRKNHGLCLDPVSARVILFGGTSLNGGNELADTWAWDGVQWQALAPLSSPQGRHGQSMASAGSSGILMYGGLRGNGSQPLSLGDTWLWNGSTWLSLGPGPSARAGTAMAHDPILGHVVLFGGYVPRFGGTVYAESWTWSPGGSWQQQFPAASPTAMAGHCMAFDPGRACVVLFGASGAGGNWEWHGTTWSPQSLPGGPSPRSSASMVTDPLRARVLLFSGSTSALLDGVGDVWRLDGNGWGLLRDATVPEAMGASALAWDALRRRTALCGGAVSGSPVNAHWEWDGRSWSRAVTTALPPPMVAAAMAFDAARGRLVMVGSSGHWEWDGITWVRRLPAAMPTAQFDHGLVFDSTRQRLVLFGGNSTNNPSQNPLAETWEWDGVNWQRMQPATAPPLRNRPAMAFDPRRGVTVLFGGTYILPFVTFVEYADTWEWDGVNWRSASPATVPLGYRSPALAYDDARQCCVLAGSTSANVVRFAEWNGVDWQNRQTPTAPADPTQPVAIRGMVYDPDQSLMIVPNVGSTSTSISVATYGPLYPARVEPFGVGCSTALGQLSLTIDGEARAWLGDTITARVRPAPAGAVASLWIGASRTIAGTLPLPLSLDFFGMSGCQLLASPDDWSRLATVGTTNAAVFALTVPVSPPLLGLDLFAQAAAADPAANVAGLVTTNGLAVRIGGR